MFNMKIELAFEGCSDSPLGHLAFVLGKYFRIPEEKVRSFIKVDVSINEEIQWDNQSAKLILYRAVDVLTGEIGENIPSVELVQKNIADIIKVFVINPRFRTAWTNILRGNPSFIRELAQFIHDNWGDLVLIAEPPGTDAEPEQA